MKEYIPVFTFIVEDVRDVLFLGQFSNLELSSLEHGKRDRVLQG